LTRFRAVAFAALLVATVAAFFVSQHLKVTTPLYNGSPRPDPAAINPIDGRICKDTLGNRVSFKKTRLSFWLQHSSDNVLVYIVNSVGEQIALVGSRYMRKGVRGRDYVWDGKESNGSFAPDGTYYFKVVLQQEGRYFELTGTPVRVITVPPHPVVTSVRVSDTATNPTGPAIISPPGSAQTVTIHFTRGSYRNALIQIYRTDLPGKPRVVKSFGVNAGSGVAVWDGMIHEQPAPAGTYLVGMRVTDAACNVGWFPAADPPTPGTTPHSGVTIRYLAAEPPLTPVGAGDRATVLVDSRLRPYKWALRAAGAMKVLAHGSVGEVAAAAGRGVQLAVKLPPLGAALYELAIRSGANRTVVPLIAAAQGRRAAARVLVVLPALSWQGFNPVDDDGDGLPNTLVGGDQIAVNRPLINGLPADLDNEQALLAYLDRLHMAFQLTTDVALAEGVGPALAGHTGVILDGSLVWLPSRLKSLLAAYAQNGGHVVSIGVKSMQQTAVLATRGGVLSAGPPAAEAVDPFGARPGAVATGNHDPILAIEDHLNIFSTSGDFPGFTSYQTIAPPAGAIASLAGTANNASSITGFRDGHGTVVEIGLAGFNSSLAGDIDSQELIRRLWQLLSG
jgi:FlgD Ig-like domain